MLTPEQAAEFLEVIPATLANWRSAGTGPKFHKKNGKKIVYFEEDLYAWIKSNGGP